MPSLTLATIHELLESPEARERHRKRRRHRVVGCTIVCTFALVFNFISYMALVNPLVSGQAKSPSAVHYVLLVIFGVVGLAAMGLALYALLSTLNPMAHAVVTPRTPALGQEFTVEWALDRHARNIRRFQVLITGTEETITRRGTDSTRSRNVFYTQTLLDTTDRGQMDGGSLRASVPAGSVPSFQGKSNAIIWAVHFKGDIPNWPDIDDVIPFEVGTIAMPSA